MNSPNIEAIIAYENGELDADQTLELFADLIKSQLAWGLQGSYGRTAMHFINNGFIDHEGNITDFGLHWVDSGGDEEQE